MARQDTERKPSTTRRMLWMLAITAVVFGGVFAVKAMINAGTNQFFDNMPQPPVAVSAYTTTQESWTDAQEAVGTVVAVNGTDVTTESAGVVKRIAFEAGQPVKAGTVLVMLNSANELALLKSLEAAARLATLQSERWRKLGQDQLVSLDEVQQRATSAASARAQVEAQRALIAQKTVRAPFDGVLGIRKVNLGQFVNPGDPIVSLQALDPIHLDFSLPEQRIAQTAEGTFIRASVDALPDRTFEGRITAIEPDVDPGTRNFAVQATLDNPDHALRPGTFARVRFDSGAPRRVIVIPQTAVSFNPYGNSVYVISEVPAAKGEKTPDGKPAGPKLVVKQRFVKTGATRGDLVAVTDGLKAGERVVTSGLLKLRNDAVVTINNKVQPSAESAPAPENR